MIAHVRGRLVAKTATSCVVEVGGIGLALALSTHAVSRLPAEGDEVALFTHLHVREDELALFGFESPDEREALDRLITVAGVGPKVPLAALSTLRPDALAEAVAREDDALIATVRGIGKKTAQRIVIELKDRLGSLTLTSGASPSTGARSEATDALGAMGFSGAEIAVALKGYDGPDDAPSLLRHALKRLGGAR
jgi:Holliday junction DNA helicase RuvA